MEHTASPDNQPETLTMTTSTTTTKPMTRKGKTLQVLRDGHPRRMSDGRNAWRKMSDEQRVLFLAWIEDNR